VKIGLKRISTQKEVIVEALLDSGAIGFVMSSEFAQMQYIKIIDGGLHFLFSLFTLFYFPFLLFFYF